MEGVEVIRSKEESLKVVWRQWLKKGVWWFCRMQSLLSLIGEQLAEECTWSFHTGRGPGILPPPTLDSTEPSANNQCLMGKAAAAAAALGSFRLAAPGDGHGGETLILYFSLIGFFLIFIVTLFHYLNIYIIHG